MDVLYLFSSILAESVGKTIDKMNYRRNHIDPRVMMVTVFFVMSFSIGLYLAFTGQHFPHISLKAALLLAGVGIFSFGGNVFDELSLNMNDLSLREPLVDFEPVLAGLVGYALFPSQRNPAFLVAFIITAFIVHWGTHRRTLNKVERQGMMYLLVSVALYAILPSLYQEALHFISPGYLALFRAIAVLVLTSIFFPPKKWRGFTATRVNYVIAAGVVYALGAIVSLYAIQVYGVVLTMLFLMLGPAMRYVASHFILRENVQRGEVLASLMLAIVATCAAFMPHMK